jgi:hypothetical protein
MRAGWTGLYLSSALVALAGAMTLELRAQTGFTAGFPRLPVQMLEVVSPAIRVQGILALTPTTRLSDSTDHAEHDLCADGRAVGCL